MSFQDCMTPIFSPADRPKPVVYSGQRDGQDAETYERTGRSLDLIYLRSGGIHGHPNGPAKGVRTICSAWEAAKEGTDLKEKQKLFLNLLPHWSNEAE